MPIFKQAAAFRILPIRSFCQINRKAHDCIEQSPHHGKYPSRRRKQRFFQNASYSRPEDQTLLPPVPQKKINRNSSVKCFFFIGFHSCLYIRFCRMLQRYCMQNPGEPYAKTCCIPRLCFCTPDTAGFSIAFDCLKAPHLRQCNNTPFSVLLCPRHALIHRADFFQRSERNHAFSRSPI